MRVSPAPPPTAAPNQPPHSPHMSPAIGGPGGVVMPPHPGSGQSDGRNSSMHAPGYPPGPPHMGSGPPGVPHGFPSKMGHMPPGSTYNQSPYQQSSGHQYPRPQGPMMQPYPQNYSQSGPQCPQPSPGHQYPPRPPHNNHVPPNQPYGYFGQGWGQNVGQGPPPGPGGMPPGGSPGMMVGGLPTKGAPPLQATPPSGPNSVPRAHSSPHPHYLKQHTQPPHKIYGPPGGPQLYPSNGPGPSPSISSMGPNSNRGDSPLGAMPPPTSTPQPLTPSSTTGDSDHPPMPPSIPPNMINASNSNNTIINNSTNSNSNNSSSGGNSNPPSIGPDGNPIVDEASQQSTVSNNSAASGDDRSITPKLHKDGSINLGLSSGGGLVGGNQHYTAVNSAPSPGSASMTSQQDELENLNSPGWPRSPNTAPPPNVPYANSQPPPPPDIYRPTKAGDSISRLYEMSDNPERRAWLDKLLAFMEENKTPITTCPTISKNPLDLYALYLHVNERGGFLEVTKNKHWKDVAAVMGIGASSSGSYTLRKHYMKHIIYYECKFDRGGVDPMPIIKQVETTAKKKSNKNISVPSPGSSNSQDSFPPACSNSNSTDGFSNGPHMPGPYPQYPPSSEYPAHMQQRPPSQTGPGYQGFSGSQYPAGYQGMHSFNQGGYPPNSGYPPEGRGYQPTGPQSNYQGFQQGGFQRPGGYPPPPGPPPGPPNQPSFPPQEQYPGYQGNSMYPPSQKPGPSPSPGPPQAPSSTQPYQGPRRHPDFEKNPPPPGWRGSSPFPGFNAACPGGPPTPAQPAWSKETTTTTSSPTHTWSQPRYPVSQASPFPSQNRWPGSNFSGGGGIRPTGPASNNKNFIIPPPTSFKSGGYGSYMGKQLFPVDSVEAVLPVLARRKRMCRTDIPTVDPWKLLMSLRCGLAAEVTWALDVLNILLYDDHTVVYFGLQHMPGLLEVLIEHLRRSLINMFDICSELELGRDEDANNPTHKIHRACPKSPCSQTKKGDADRQWYERPPPSPSLELDLGLLDDNQDPNDKEVLIRNGCDFTLVSKTGKPVKVVKKEGELFLREGTRDWDKYEGFSSGMDTWSVGGGECTSHIICSMQSDVLPLPFTRILLDAPGFIKQQQQQQQMKSPVVIQTSDIQEVVLKKEIKMEVDEEVKTVCAGDGDYNMQNTTKVKIEKMEVDNVAAVVENKPVAVDSAEETSPVKKESNDKDTSEKCNGPKDIQSTTTKNSAHSQQRVNRFNNAKSGTGKLDNILKRLVKTPICSGVVSASNNNTKDNNNKDNTVISDNMDSKQLLDMVFKKEPIIEDKNEDRKDHVKVEKVLTIKHDDTVILEKSKEDRHSKQYPMVRLERRNKNTYNKTASKRTYDDLEEESWSPDEASLSITNEGQDWLARRVMCIGTVIRNLSFIPGNDEVMSKCAPLLALLGKTILLHHDHPARYPSTAHYDRDEEGDVGDWCSSLSPDNQWWWPYLYHVHENTLVILSNMSTNLDLSYYPEEITLPVLDGLLHWATCPASYGQDPLPGGGTSSQSSLSPQRLALESLVKLCVLDQNTDLVLATPSFARLDALCNQLTRMLCRGEDQVLREFSVNLLHYFSAADSGIARLIAMQNGCVSLLVAFIEEAEAAAMNVANVQGVSALKENPELMGTSLDMVRRSANTLVHLSRAPDNACILAAYENRLLTLVMSQILDTYVASQLSQVLFNVAQVQVERPAISNPSPPSSPEPEMSTEQQEISPPVSTIEEKKPSPVVTEAQSTELTNHTDSSNTATNLTVNTVTESPKTSTQVSPISNVSKDMNHVDTESGYVSSTTTTSSSDSSSTASSTLTISAHSPAPPSTPTEAVVATATPTPVVNKCQVEQQQQESNGINNFPTPPAVVGGVAASNPPVATPTL